MCRGRINKIFDFIRVYLWTEIFFAFFAFFADMNFVCKSSFNIYA